MRYAEPTLRVYRMLQEFAEGYRSLQKVIGVCRRLQEFAEGYRSLQKVIGVCRRLQEFAEGYRSLQKVIGVCRSSYYKDGPRTAYSAPIYPRIHTRMHPRIYCTLPVPDLIGPGASRSLQVFAEVCRRDR